MPAGPPAWSLVVFGHIVVGKVEWKIQWRCFLIPVVFYGVLFLGPEFPEIRSLSKGSHG